MSSQCYSPEFKDEAVRQIVERGYSVAEVSERLGVSSHSLYKWVKAVKPGKTEQHEADLVEASRVYSVCPKTSQARSHSFLIAWPRGVSWRSSNRPWPPVRSVD